MDSLLWYVLPLLLAPIGWFLWTILIRSTLRGDFAPSIFKRVESVLGPHEGRPASAEVLADLQRQVDLVVRDTLVDLHHSAEDLVVIIRNDDVLGPRCFLKIGDGSELSLAEFEARLRS